MDFHLSDCTPPSTINAHFFLIPVNLVFLEFIIDADAAVASAATYGFANVSIVVSQEAAANQQQQKQ